MFFCPNFNCQKGALAIPLIGIILLLSGLGGGSYVYAQKQKQEIKGLAKEEVKNLASLEDKYRKIVDAYKESQKDEEKIQSTGLKMALAGREKNVLGLEDSPAIALKRQLNELYRDSKSAVSDIKNANGQVAKKLKNPIVMVFVDRSAPSDETDKFINETENLLNFLEKDNNLSVKATTYGYDLGISLAQAILNYGELSSVERLEEKIKDLDELEKEFDEIDQSTIPVDLKADYLKSIEEYKSFKKAVVGLAEALKKQDFGSVQRIASELDTDTAVSQEKEFVKLMSFWQNNTTIRAVEGVKKKWEEYAQKLE